MKQAFPKEAFYSKLTDEGTTDEDYQHAQTVWKEFNIESMKDYHHLRNLSDVLLLSDIFEHFRNICNNHYELHPAWYFSASDLAWDAASKITKVQFELLNETGMMLMIESGIRRGMATISRSHAKANNEYIKTEFNHTEESKFISYLDTNKLYGLALPKTTSNVLIYMDD